MTILLSGATGFLGSNLLKRFTQEGFDVIALKRSTSDTYRIEELLSKITYYDVEKTEIKEIFKKHNIDISVDDEYYGWPQDGMLFATWEIKLSVPIREWVDTLEREDGNIIFDDMWLIYEN